MLKKLSLIILFLVLVQAASATYLANYTILSINNGYKIGNRTNDSMASQTFTINTSSSGNFTVTNISVYLYRSGTDGSTTRTVNCGIWGVTPEHFNETQYGDNYTATVNTATMSATYTSPTTYTLLAAGIAPNLTNATKYALKCSMYTNATYIAWSGRNTGGAYTGGALSYWNGTQMLDQSGGDFKFIVEGNATTTTNTCTYPGTGNWAITDNCNLSTNTIIAAGANVSIAGAVSVNISANITGWTKFTASGGSRVTIKDGNKVRRA